MAFTNYQFVNSLEEIQIIAGTYYTLEFSVYNESGTPMDLSGATYNLVLCPYGDQTNVVLDIEGEYVTDSTFTFTLSSNDTVDLFGKHIYQPVITSLYGKVYRPQQGIINFIPAIK